MENTPKVKVLEYPRTKRGTLRLKVGPLYGIFTQKKQKAGYITSWCFWGRTPKKAIFFPAQYIRIAMAKANQVFAKLQY